MLLNIFCELHSVCNQSAPAMSSMFAFQTFIHKLNNNRNFHIIITQAQTYLRNVCEHKLVLDENQAFLAASQR